MNHFEHLPNELLITIFEYFHADELFRTFFNLNTRFHNLIKSLNYLCLVISQDNQNAIENFRVFSSELYTLVIDGYVDMNIYLFPNIHRLTLINPTNKILPLFNICNFPRLEYLSVRYVDSTYRNFYGREMMFSSEPFHRQTQTLHILKIEYVELSVFKRILSICPNLYYLDMGIIIPSKSSSTIEPHMNLKHLILRTSYNRSSESENESVLKDLFSCLPKLEKLSIHRRNNISIIRPAFIKYDWYSSLLSSYFPLLRRFYCYFHLLHVNNVKIVIGPNLKIVLHRIMENFQNIYKNRYDACLIID